MHPTLRKLSGGSGPPDTKNGNFLGNWGNIGSQPQKGITSYSLSANRQRPLAGTLNAAIFNSWRRFRGQALFVIPPFVAAYMIVGWAIEKNEFYNSKEGRRLEAQATAEAEANAETV